MGIAIDGPVDYVVIGHLTRDLTPAGASIGGTVSYASVTARAMGLQVGVVTSWDESLPLGCLDGIPIANRKVRRSTTFENLETPDGRRQTIFTVADHLDISCVPPAWHEAGLVHLGPVAREVSPDLCSQFPSALVGVSPQGWLRDWDAQGSVTALDWQTFLHSENYRALSLADVTTISIEDVGRVQRRVEDLASICPILAVTDAANGSYLYWQGKTVHFPAPSVKESDSVGAGDIYAAAIIHRLHQTEDPLEAARFATHLAAYSVTRPGLAGAPTRQEIDLALKGVF